MAAISHENEIYLLRQSKPYLTEAVTELGEMAHSAVRAISRSQKCGNRVSIQQYKQRVNEIILHDFHDSFFSCVEKYEHWGLDQNIDYTPRQRIRIGYMLEGCAETAKRLTQNLILDIIWECLNVKRPARVPWSRN